MSAYLSMLWTMGWMLGTQALPMVDLQQIPAAHQVYLGTKKVALRPWLLGMESLLNQGRGDGRLTKAEFLLARELRPWKQLRRWETFAQFVQFVLLSRNIGRCYQQKERKCPVWPPLPIFPQTMTGVTQDKRVTPQYHYSRYARLCREMAHRGTRQSASSGQYTRAMRRLQLQRKQMQALVQFVEELPRFQQKEQWTRYLKKQWLQAAFQKKMRAALGFAPTKKQLRLVIRLIQGGQRPGPADMLRLAQIAMSSPLRNALAPNALSGWMIWGGDQRNKRVRWKDWMSFLKGAPASCQSPQRKMLSRQFFCGTTLGGAYAILSKSMFLNHFVRRLIEPFHAHTFDEGLRSCLAERIGLWMTSGYGKRCFSVSQKSKLFRLLARVTMGRYEAYGPVRARALHSLAQWRPGQALPCVIRALHPRREPRSYVRTVAIQALVNIAKRLPSKRGLAIKYLRRAARQKTNLDVYFEAVSGLLQLRARAVVPQMAPFQLYSRKNVRRTRNASAPLLSVYYRRNMSLACSLVQSYMRKGKRVKRSSYHRIPSHYWSVLQDELSVHRYTIPQRRMLVQMAQCSDAPMLYLQRLLRWLQPRYEPEPEIRLLLWRSLQRRWLYLGRQSALPMFGEMFALKWRLRRILRLYVTYVGLAQTVETNVGIRRFVQAFGARLR